MQPLPHSLFDVSDHSVRAHAHWRHGRCREGVGRRWHWRPKHAALAQLRADSAYGQSRWRTGRPTDRQPNPGPKRASSPTSTAARPIQDRVPSLVVSRPRRAFARPLGDALEVPLRHVAVHHRDVVARTASILAAALLAGSRPRPGGRAAPGSPAPARKRRRRDGCESPAGTARRAPARRRAPSGTRRGPHSTCRPCSRRAPSTPGMRARRPGRR